MKNRKYEQPATNWPDLEALLDFIADRVAARIEHRMNRSQTSTQRRLLTVLEAAKYLGRTSEAVQHLVNSGKIRAVRFDKRVHIDVGDLDRLIEESK